MRAFLSTLILILSVSIHHTLAQSDIDSDLEDLILSTNSTSLTNSTVVVEFDHEYILDSEYYDFAVQEYYFYEDGNFIDDPYINYTVCNPENRPTVCYDTFNPVCAYITSCPDGMCTKTVQNDCYACIDTNISWFIPGPCEEVKLNCSASGESCTSNYEPVCGVASECAGDYCCITVINSCQACNYPYIDYLLPGQCPNVTSIYVPIGSDEEEIAINGAIMCDPNNRPLLCSFDYNPVCAHDEGCYQDQCSWTAGNPCIACNNETIDYYTWGTCLNQNIIKAEVNASESARILCNPIDRPLTCPLDYEPVCTWAQNCSGLGCNGSVVNPCVACSIVNSDYYLNGEC